MFKNNEEKQLSRSHSSMLRTEVRDCHRLPDREIASGSFGTSVSQRDLTEVAQCSGAMRQSPTPPL